jgi:sugar phosphate isomerase/epimerase
LAFTTLVFPYVFPQDRPKDRAGYEAIAARLSSLGRTASTSGLQLCYHNHAFEFATDRDGTRWLDVLMNATEAAGMQLELDVFWAAIAGADPVALLKRYAGRVPLVHLKNKDPAAARTLLETQVPRTAFVEVGSGALDFAAILSAARSAGVRHFFVEQDQTPADPIDSLRKSFNYLNALK